MELSEHLFRHEAGRMVATLTRMFGVHNLALAEDIVQDAFCRALEVWKFRGVPENPSAWLMAVAKNRALDLLRRDRTVRTYEPELGRLLQSEWTLAPTVEELLTENTIEDEQLRMMFACCHPRLSEEARAPGAASKRFVESLTRIASLVIPSTMLRSASSNCRAVETRLRASTSPTRSGSRATPWNENSSNSAWMPVGTPPGRDPQLAFE